MGPGAAAPATGQGVVGLLSVLLPVLAAEFPGEPDRVDSLIVMLVGSWYRGMAHEEHRNHHPGSLCRDRSHGVVAPSELSGLLRAGPYRAAAGHGSFLPGPRRPGVPAGPDPAGGSLSSPGSL